MKISDVLWKAANEHLWDGLSEYKWGRDRKARFSCDAIRHVTGSPMPENLSRGLRRMGLDTDSIYAFAKFPEGPASQGARYAWLMFAREIALEQGL